MSAAGPSAQDPAPGPGVDVSRLSVRLGVLLRAGVVSSAVLLALGVALTVGLDPSLPIDRTLDLGALGTWGVSTPGIVLTALGFAVLLATPVARVVVSLAAFARAGERDFVGIVAAVLVVLFASVLVGLWA